MDLAAPIQEVKGIGPKTAEVLHKAGIFTLRDLVYHLPRDYEDFQQAQNIVDLRPGNVTIKARVEEIKTRRMRRNLSLTEATLRDKSGAIRAIWFNQPYRAKQFDSKKEYYFSGAMASDLRVAFDSSCSFPEVQSLQKRVYAVFLTNLQHCR